MCVPKAISKLKLRLLYCHPPQLRPPRLMRQFELFAIITQPHSCSLLHAKRVVGCVCLLNPPASQSETKHGQIRHRHCH